MAPTIEETLRKHTDALMSLPGVVLVAQNEKDGRPGILVMASKVSDELTARIPDEMDGFPVSLVESGDITAR